MDKEQGEGGFFSRWSRRKAQANGSEPTGLVEAPRLGPPSALSTRPPAVESQSLPASEQAREPAPLAAAQDISPASPPAAPRPTLEDVEQLDAASDYRAYVARDVDPDVRNAAFKKLFHSDPHFNVMDGLDVYIDDYNTPNPLPVAIMKTLVQARAMGLIDDELKEQDPPSARSEGSQGANVDSTQEGSETVADPQLNESAQAQPVHSGSAAQGVADEEGLVELVAVPDTASNDETLSPQPSPGADAGTVVPFPRRPGSADPA